jgi:hypothetical protein
MRANRDAGHGCSAAYENGVSGMIDFSLPKKRDPASLLDAPPL